MNSNKTKINSIFLIFLFLVSIFSVINITSSTGQNVPIAQAVSNTYNYTLALSGGFQITLYNNQNVSTVSGFQQLLQLNLTSLGITNLGGIRFYDLNNNPLYAWLESYNTTTGIAYIWVNLGNDIIPANGTLIIYMAYNPNTNFDGIYWGEAPQLSSIYGQYDNGVNVFSLYANGNTPISNFTVPSGGTLSQATGVAYGSTTINALKFTGAPQYFIDFYINNISVPASYSYIAEGNGEWYTNTTSGDTVIVALLQNPSPSTQFCNAISVGGIPGYKNSYFEQDYMSSNGYILGVNSIGSAGQSWVYGSLTYIAGSSTFSAYTAPQLYSTSGGYSGSATNPITTSGGNLYLGVTGSQTGSTPANAYWNWLRVREYPPNGVMPSISNITFTYNNYAIISVGSTVNITNSNNANATWYMNGAVVSTNTTYYTTTFNQAGIYSIYYVINGGLYSNYLNITVYDPSTIVSLAYSMIDLSWSTIFNGMYSYSILFNITSSNWITGITVTLISTLSNGNSVLPVTVGWVFQQYTNGSFVNLTGSTVTVLNQQNYTFPVNMMVSSGHYAITFYPLSQS
ncbi:MAG: DUF2341 domain-containing protein, partial [Candidatus Parvarchaeota archaeon]